MTCVICDRETTPRTEAGHCLETSPIEADMCLGCWIETVNLELFLIRGNRSVGIGGYVKVREILRGALAAFGSLSDD